MICTCAIIVTKRTYSHGAQEPISRPSNHPLSYDATRLAQPAKGDLRPCTGTEGAQ